jgi:hypothetical protein
MVVSMVALIGSPSVTIPVVAELPALRERVINCYTVVVREYLQSVPVHQSKLHRWLLVHARGYPCT